MHKHFSGRRNDSKYFAYADIDGDRDQPRRNRNKIHRVRHKPYEKYSRSRQIDWFEDEDDDY